MKTYYIIDGDNNVFSTLRDAKFHICCAYTAKERIKYLQDATICKVHNDEIVSYTPIRIDEDGNVTYGKTKKW